MNENGGDMNAAALPGDLLRIKEAAERFGISARTVREWLRLGRIHKYVQAGHWVYVSAGEIERLRRIERVNGDH
jgi:excisionase family DNA binding protein